MHRELLIVGLVMFISGLALTLLTLNEVAELSGSYYEYPFMTQKVYYARVTSTMFLTALFSFFVLFGASLIRRSGRG
ncbi:MAG: hypothetical protein ACP5GO_05135 [Thermoprotei archaeon]